MSEQAAQVPMINVVRLGDDANVARLVEVTLGQQTGVIAIATGPEPESFVFLVCREGQWSPYCDECEHPPLETVGDVRRYLRQGHEPAPVSDPAGGSDDKHDSCGARPRPPDRRRDWRGSTGDIRAERPDRA